MTYDYKEVVKKVDGLNSVSTLKKWRKKVEDLTGIEFKESLTGIRESYSVRIFLFSDKDVSQFQEVARMKSQLGLDNAILQAFSPDKKLQKSISERVELLEFVVIDSDQKVSLKLSQLHQENQTLKQLVKRLEQRSTQIEEQLKPKKLFKKN